MNEITLPADTIMHVEVGSTAHGTNIEGQDDRDEAVVFVETEAEVFGRVDAVRNRMLRTQPEGVRSGPGDVDLTCYPLRRFLHLAAQGNPSVLMMLWCPLLGDPSPAMRHLRDEGTRWFVGRHMIPRFRGYMKSQTERLLGVRGSGHGVRGGGGRVELIAEHGYDTKYAMHAARLAFQCIELMATGELLLPIGGEPGQWLRSVRRGEVPFDEWFGRVLLLDGTLGSMVDNEGYWMGPDRESIAAFSVKAHREVWDHPLISG